jgi:hypothetical protein
MPEDTPTIVLLDGASRPAHYANLRQQFEARYVLHHQPLESGMAAEQIDLAMVSDEFHSLITNQLVKLRTAGVPVLHVVDGITEWRNTWENPRSARQEDGMPLFQPILSDKIACFGRAQARILESWGNLGKCEIVGAPRLDHLLGRQPRRRGDQEPARLLIMTARTPGFTPQQVERCCQSLVDLYGAIERFNRDTHKPHLEPVWRVADEAQERLKREYGLKVSTNGTLSDVLETVDAVVTTPSTVMLESMLQGVPVALLDYHNCPHYVPAAWTITTREHMPQVLSELVRPPVAKLVWQDTILHDNLECRTPATPRLVQLVEQMVDRCRQCRRDGVAVTFPGRLLPDDLAGHHLPEERYDLRRLYPEHPVFSQLELAETQAALGHAHRQLRLLAQELDESYNAQSYYWKYTVAGRIQRLWAKLRRKRE